ncbi:DNA-binding protein reb1 [Sphaceloma murrayae]|uniref:DNA-binding protein reb1 n=1 Tax=Sphaceloma murrayae TaxID=2082308 RepID=A0A2K1QHP5_9PEZI|nr:DNA-binding protein reb1 [Sphaceloma murrayae]
MGNSSSQLADAEHSQQQPTPSFRKPLGIDGERAQPIAPLTKTLTPPPTALFLTESDSRQLNPSIDEDNAEKLDHQRSRDPMTRKLRPTIQEEDLDDLKTSESTLDRIPRFDGAADTLMAESIDDPNSMAPAKHRRLTSTERREKADRRRIRNEKRARKESRKLQRALAAQRREESVSRSDRSQVESPLQTTLAPALPIDDIEVPDTQPEPLAVTPKDAYLREDDLDEPGTQLRMEAERAYERSQAALLRHSSPSFRSQKPLKQYSLKKRRAERVASDEEQVDSPAMASQSRKRPMQDSAESAREDSTESRAIKRAKTKGKHRQPPTKERASPGLRDDEQHVPERPAMSSPTFTAIDTPSRPAQRSLHGVTGDESAPRRSYGAKRRDTAGRSSATELHVESKNGAPASGPFSEDERARVERAVESYRELHGLSESAFREMMQANNTTKAILGEVFYTINEALPRRSRKSIRQFCQRKYNNAHRAPWTTQEDDELKEAYEEKPGNWVHIGQLLGRMAEDCRDRWRDHVGVPDKVEGAWSPEEEQALEKAIAECISRMRKEGDDTYAGVNDADLEPRVNWQVVSDILGKKRSRLQCRYKWAKLRNRKIRIAESDTPESRKQKSVGRRHGNANAGSERDSSGWAAINTSTPTAPFHGARSYAATSLGASGLKSAKSKKAVDKRVNDNAHSRKKYKSAARVTAEDDDDEIEDDVQTEQADPDSMEIYDIPQSPANKTLITTSSLTKSRSQGQLLRISGGRPTGQLQRGYRTNIGAGVDSHLDTAGKSKPVGDLYYSQRPDRPGEKDTVSQEITEDRSNTPKEAQDLHDDRSTRRSMTRGSHTPRVVPSVRYPLVDNPGDARILPDRAPSPLTSENAPVRRARTPPDEKHWLPGDIFRMLVDLMDAQFTVEFHDLGSYLEAIRNVCGEETYTAEDRVTQYWKLVKELGLHKGLRSNLFAAMDHMNARYEPKILAQTSAGDVVYGMSLDDIAGLTTTPPDSDDVQATQAADQLLAGQRRYLRMRRRGSSTMADEDPLSVRDFAIDAGVEALQNRANERQIIPVHLNGNASNEAERAEANRQTHRRRHTQGDRSAKSTPVAMYPRPSSRHSMDVGQPSEEASKSVGTTTKVAGKERAGNRVRKRISDWSQNVGQQLSQSQRIIDGVGIDPYSESESSMEVRNEGANHTIAEESEAASPELGTTWATTERHSADEMAGLSAQGDKRYGKASASVAMPYALRRDSGSDDNDESETDGEADERLAVASVEL